MNATGAYKTQRDTEQPDPQTETTEDSVEDERPPQLSLDVIFDVLRNRRRRLVMEAIEDRDGETTLSDLAEHIGGIENEKPPSALNAQERKRVYVGLYQCHLPRMDDAGAIDFDKNRGTVERGPQADAYLTYLERDEEPAREWPKYYGILAGTSFVAFVFSWLVSPGTETAVFVASVLLLFGMSWYHRTAQRPN